MADYLPDQDPEIILLRLAHRRAELAHWQAVARRWWAALATLLTLYNLTIFLGLPGDVQIITGILAIISGVCLGCWHHGNSRGTQLRRSIEEGERDHLAAIRREEHDAAAEAQQAEEARLAAEAAAEPPPIFTTRMRLPGQTGDLLVVAARAVRVR